MIDDVEAAIKDRQRDSWDRELFEKNLMGYTMKTDQHRLVVWKDTQNPDAKPLFSELFDHKTDRDETRNIANEQPELVKRLLAQFDAGWQASSPP